MAPELLRFEVIPETMHFPLPLARSFFSHYLYPHLPATDLIRQFFRHKDNILLIFPIGSRQCRGGGLVVSSDSSLFIRVHPSCSSMYSTSLQEVHSF